MRPYGQFCPVAKAAQLFCERWTPLILRDMSAGATRFSELQRGVPLMSPTLLSNRLKQLVAEGIVEKRRAGDGGGSDRRGNWTYHLTDAGREFVPLVEALGVWGQRWARRQLAEDEIDLGLLIWSVERGVDPAAFAGTRTVVRLELTDQPANKTLWWFVNQDEGCQLCLEDPGFDVDLYLACTLPDMIYVVRGDLALNRAIADGRLEVLGAARTRRALAAWLNLGPLTKVASVRAEAQAAAE